MIDEDWEPSESETLIINMPTTLSFADIQYKLTCLIAEAIRHVKKYYYTRPPHHQPTVAEQVGEFVTEIRRLFRGSYTDLAELGFRDLTNTEMWVNVAVPNPKCDYKWRFSYSTSGGSMQVNQGYAQNVCANASKMAESDKTLDDEFREINNGLNNLMRETTALDSLIYRAKDLNSQASVVVDNLCAIAEKLNQE